MQIEQLPRNTVILFNSYYDLITTNLFYKPLQSFKRDARHLVQKKKGKTKSMIMYNQFMSKCDEGGDSLIHLLFYCCVLPQRYSPGITVAIKELYFIVQ